MSETSQNRYALLIAADAYTDPALGALCAPQQDVTDLARVLEAPEIGGFTDVVPLVNPDVQAVRERISDFLRDKRRDDLLLLYFSGHGVIDRADGHFYLAFGETEQEDPSVAGLPADWITRQLDRRTLQRVVVILDCCYSGRFEGTKGADDLDLDAIFNTGYGRVVLTASRASERSWDGNVLSTPEGAPIPHSLFTHYLVEGLETGLGGASAEPFITVDALYEYAYRRVMETAKSELQTPTKFARQEGSPLVLARNPRPALAPAPLPGTLGRIFISYSPTDGVARAEALYDALAREGVPVWLDRRDVRPGLAPEGQVEAALQECRAVLLLLTPDAAAPGCDCEREWRQALRYKKPIVPLLAGGEPPFYLQNRRAFSPEGADWPAALRQYLDWLSGPEGQLQTLRDRRGDAERDLRTADPPEAARIRSEMELLDRQIRDLTTRLAHPEQAAQETDLRIRSGLERERQPLAPVGGKVARIINAPPYAPPAHFQDRDTELRLLARYLRDPACRLVTVVGRAGVGKTAMVLKLLKAAENGRLPVLQEGEDERFPVEGILYLSQVIGRPISWPNLHADLCRLLPGAGAEAATAVYRDPQAPLTAKVQALLAPFAERRVLVLLDNLEDLVDPATRELTDAELAEALTAFLRAPQHGVTLLATTRVAPRALTLVEPGRQHTLELDTGLASPHAEAVLRALDADGSVGLRDAPDALLGQAREATRGYPRALEALYAILSADRYTTLAEVLSRAEEALPENVVAALVGDAYSRLDPAAQQVLQALAVYNRPATPAAVDYLLRPYLPGVDSAPILQRLTVMHFARREGERYSLHPVDRAYAFSRIPPHTQPAFLSRAADYYREARKPRAAWKTLDDLAPQLAEFELRCAAGEYDAAADVLTDIDFDYLLLWGHVRLMARLHEQLQGKLRDRRLASISAGNLGNAYSDLGRIAEALDCYQQALAIDREIGDRRGEGVDLGNLGNAYRGLGRIAEAIAYHEQALTIAREIGDRRGEGADLGDLGNAYYSLGRSAEAIAYYEQALTIAREIGDRRNEGVWLSNLGIAYRDLWRIAEAIAYHEQALTIAREIGARRLEGNALGNLGIAYYSLGRIAEAIAYHEQALAIDREIGDRRGEGADLGALGLAYSDLGRIAEAIDCYEQALTIAREIGDRRGEGADLGNLGLAYSDLGRIAEAIDCYEQALAIAREIGDRRGEGNHLGNLGNAYYSLGRIAEAIAYYEQALAIAREIGDRRGEGNHLGNLGLAYSDLGRSAEALDFYEQVLAIAREIGDRRNEGAWLGNLGNAYSDLGCIAEAIAYYEQALTIAREIGDRRGEGHRLGNLGLAYSDLGRIAEALDFYQQALAIDREIGDRRGEGVRLGNLGLAYRGLGRIAEAIDCYEQALAIDREIGDRRGEGVDLGNLAEALLAQGDLAPALTRAQESVRIAGELAAPDLASYAGTTLALIHASAGDFAAALAAAETACAHACPLNAAAAHALRGSAAWRLGRVETAREAFRAACAAVEAVPDYTALYEQLDALGVARCGLALVEPEQRDAHLQAAREAFRAARALTAAPGIVADVQRRLALLDGGFEDLARG